MAPSSASASAKDTRAQSFLAISGNTASLRDLRIAVARLLQAACVAIVGLLSLPAHAAIPASTGVYFNTSFGRSDPFQRSADACADLAVKIGVATELRLAYSCYYDARRWGGYGFELAERLVSSP